MPFAVFRRHQRKLLAIFAILAMFGFVLADSLPRLLSGGYGGGNTNPVVVKLFGRSIHRSDINEMAAERSRANKFMAELFGFGGRPFFGDVSSTRAMVDALILQHEADALKMPNGPEVAREWLKQMTNNQMSRELFEGAMRSFGNQTSGEQVLHDIANQLRLSRVRQLLGNPVVTPLDVFKAYRDQNERVAVKAVSFPVSSYISKVADPSDAEVRHYYEKYKDVLPNSSSDTPGFKIPRQIRAEILSIDGAALARQIRDKLPESELRSYYENRKSEFIVPTGFPNDIFANDPKAELTPPRAQPFEEVRPYLATSLADEKAQAEIVNRFAQIKDEVMIPFTDTYYDALDEINEAKKSGAKTSVKLPMPKDLKAVAKQEGLDHEITPLLTREQAETYGQISSAEVGLTRLSGGRKFADEMFDAKTNLYEPVELTDAIGRRFLARKLDDQAPRVPPLDEIRPEVVLAWKMEHARPLAEKAAREFAAKVLKEGGTIKADQVDGRPVITTDPVIRMQPGFPMGPPYYQSGPATPTEISQIPKVTEGFRDAYFGLEPGQVAVEPNQPKDTFYVMTLERRIPATFATLFAPNGDYIRYQREAQTQAMQERDQEWMKRLRAQAGLDTDWVPSDEANRESSSRS
jgi:peptidyl-prolyl cis-trans isomerase D